MKKFVIIALASAAWFIVAACLILTPGYVRAKRAAIIVNTMNSLKVARIDREQDGQFTNIASRFCRIFDFTNHYALGSNDYQCVMAADSWDYRDSSNLLAITTNGVILFIDKQRIVPLNNFNRPPGY